MKLSKEEVKHVARLARLSVSEEEIEVFRRQLSEILTYIGKLNELETSNIEPTSHVLDIQNVFREDRITPSLSQEEALTGAPEQEEGFFRVPKIIEERS